MNIDEIYYRLIGKKFDEAVLDFDQLNIDKGTPLEKATIADSFFHIYRVGNIISDLSEPYERFLCYEELLKCIEKHVPDKYKKIHKGTVFYLIAWLAFDIKQYEKALFYMDAALAEDFRLGEEEGNNDRWKNVPIGYLIKLENNINQPAGRVLNSLIGVVDSNIDRANKDCTLGLTREIFVTTIVKLMETKSMSIVSALYIFLLEFDDIYQMLKLRSKEGGSIQPLESHLLMGCVIFESLIKYKYNTQSYNTLGAFKKCDIFLQDYSLIEQDININWENKILKELLDEINDNKFITAFNTIGRLRNCIAHKLDWDDIFDDPENYKKLYDQIVNGIFYLLK